MKKVIPWIVLVVGFAVTGYAMVNGFRDFVSSIEPVARWQAPGAETVGALPAGNWVIFQQTDARSGGSGRGSGGDFDGSTSDAGRDDELIDWKALTVVGPQGRVATACVYCSGSETLTLGSTRYVGIAKFTAVAAGDYTITTETAAAELALAPPALQTVTRTFGSLAWFGFGLLLVGVAVTWLLVLLIMYLSRPKDAPAP